MKEKEIKYCECGCGQIVKNRFIKGHWIIVNNRINNPAKRDEVKLKMSENHADYSGEKHPRWGMKCEEETKQKISISLKKTYQDFGNPLKGFKHSDEARKNMSESAKIKIFTEEHRINLGKAKKGKQYTLGFKHTDYFRERRSEIMKGNKNLLGHIPSDETRKKISDSHKGNKSTFWQGGISFEPYTPEFNKALKRQIRERDNFNCQYPSCNIKNKSLHCHHIDYVKENSIPENLISLCSSHHPMSNTNREFWTLFYSEVMTINSMNLKYRVQSRINI